MTTGCSNSSCLENSYDLDPAMVPQGGGEIWQQEMCRLLGWGGPDTRWPRTGKSGLTSASNATVMTAKADNTAYWHPSTLDVHMCAHVDALSGVKEISNDRVASVMACNNGAADKGLPPFVEEPSDRETSPDIHIIAVHREP